MHRGRQVVFNITLTSEMNKQGEGDKNGYSHRWKFFFLFSSFGEIRINICSRLIDI